MIWIRTEFQCTLDHTQEVSAQFAALARTMSAQKVARGSRLQIDRGDRFDTVVLESVILSMDSYLALLQAALAGPEVPEDAAL